MIEFLQHNMAPVMFGGLIVFLLMGYSEIGRAHV